MAMAIDATLSSDTAAPQEPLRDFLAQRHDLMAFLFTLVRDPHLAEDLFQEVWVQFDKAQRKGQTINSLPAWCRGVARHLFSHHVRSRQRSPVIMDEELVALVELAFEESADARLETEEKLAAVRTCMDTLPLRSRSILRLRYEEGLPNAEIASRFKMKVESIHVALCRLRQAVGQCARQRLTEAQS
jgi:RNA polymerase sigma-70 factor, ECF subfamily